MTEPDFGRPGSAAAGHHVSSIPSSPRPTSRASRSSLRRERPENATNPRPSSAAQLHSQLQSPQPVRIVDDLTRPPSQQAGLPTFSPTFTLVTSNTYQSQRQTIHHPTIHYIFADDDPDLWTEVLTRHQLVENELEAGAEVTGHRPRERAIVVDMVPTDDKLGFGVGWASSLSLDWAVVDAHISQMESIDGTLAVAQGDRSGAPMLKIEGVRVGTSSTHFPSTKTPTPEGELQSSGASGARPPRPQLAAEEYADLISDFERRMEVLRRVVKAGNERQQVLVADDEADGNISTRKSETSGRD